MHYDAYDLTQSEHVVWIKDLDLKQVDKVIKLWKLWVWKGRLEKNYV